MKRITILLALATIFVAGCGDKAASGGGSGDTPRTFTITMIAKSTTNPVFPSARTGAEAAAKELGKADNLNIVIDWQTPEKEDGQIQAQNIQSAVTRHSDAILISCSDAAKVTGAIDDAVAAGIPVMCFDSDAPKSKRFAFYGVDDHETGMMVMKELAKQTDGKANVAILAGNQNAPNLQLRVQGVRDAAKDFPNIKIIDVVNHTETPEDASAAVTAEMNAHPEVNAWAMIGGWPLFAKSLLTELPSRHTKVVAVDALPAELAYVDAGIAPELLAQPTYKWGYESVKIIIDKVVHKKDVPEINKMDLVPVTKETLGSWARQLKAWQFPGIDQKYLDMK
jgi:ribose transport system substrate-binding protein